MPTGPRRWPGRSPNRTGRPWRSWGRPAGPAVPAPAICSCEPCGSTPGRRPPTCSCLRHRRHWRRSSTNSSLAYRTSADPRRSHLAAPLAAAVDAHDENGAEGQRSGTEVGVLGGRPSRTVSARPPGRVRPQASARLRAASVAAVMCDGPGHRPPPRIGRQIATGLERLPRPWRGQPLAHRSGGSTDHSAGSAHGCSARLNVPQWIGINAPCGTPPWRSRWARRTSSGVMWMSGQNSLYAPTWIMVASNGPCSAPMSLKPPK